MPPHPLTRQGIGAGRILGYQMYCVATRCLGAPCPLRSPRLRHSKTPERFVWFNGGFSLSQWGYQQERVNVGARLRTPEKDRSAALERADVIAHE